MSDKPKSYTTTQLLAEIVQSPTGRVCIGEGQGSPVMVVSLYDDKPAPDDESEAELAARMLDVWVDTGSINYAPDFVRDEAHLSALYRLAATALRRGVVDDAAVDRAMPHLIGLDLTRVDSGDRPGVRKFVRAALVAALKQGE